MKLWGFVDGELKDLKAEIELLKRYRDEAESDAAVARLLVDKLRLTDEERAAIDRARRAFRDMDHNSMTMQQVEDYEALCDLLERHGPSGHQE